MAFWMAGAVERRSRCLARGYLPPPPEVPRLPLTLDLLDLIAAVERVVSGILHPVLHRVVARPLDVEGAARRLEALLDEHVEFVWTLALGPRPTIGDILSVLLALLELARRGRCLLSQPAVFSPLLIRRDTALPAT